MGYLKLITSSCQVFGPLSIKLTAVTCRAKAAAVIKLAYQKLLLRVNSQ